MTTGSAIVPWGRSLATGVAAGALGLCACGRLAGGSGGAAGGGADQGSDDGGSSSITTADAGVVASCNANASFAPARITVISDSQFSNAVRDAFGVEVLGPATMNSALAGVYAYDENATVQVPMVQEYLKAADQVASKLKPCGAAPLDAACIEQFLRTTLPRAWRRPIEEAEITGILQLFKAGLEISADRAVQVTMEAVLTSGSFLYRSEIGGSPPAASDPSVALTPYELAAAVSFALANSVPDADLDAKAADGSLTQPSVLSAELDRLLAMEVVQANLQRRVSYFLNLEKVPFVTKDQPAFSQYTPSLRDGLYQGVQTFLSGVMRQGHFSDLFTSHRVYANQEVATVYGLPAVAGTDLVALDIPGDERGAGILTQPAFLAATNIHAGTDDIVHRGLFTYNFFVCGIALGNPPSNEDSVFSTLTGTERERALKRDKLSCGACHGLFDPFGLVSESYDPIGRYRTVDPEKLRKEPIDVSAVIERLGPDMDGPVSGINEVASRLAKGRRASDCAAVHLVDMALDHRGADDSCELQQVKDEFAKSGSFARLFKAIVTSPAFLTRDWDKK